MDRTRTCGQGRGFTLIELLVVIAVIALLMAVLLPVLGRVHHAKYLGYNRIATMAAYAKTRQETWGINNEIIQRVTHDMFNISLYSDQKKLPPFASGEFCRIICRKGQPI